MRSRRGVIWLLSGVGGLDLGLAWAVVRHRLLDQRGTQWPRGADATERKGSLLKWLLGELRIRWQSEVR